MPFQSLKFKIQVAITATCLLVALCFGAIVYPFELNRRAARFAEARTLVSAVFEQRREEFANEIYAHQEAALTSSLNSIKEVKGITKVIIYGTTGAAIAATEPGLDSRIGPAELSALDQGPGMARTRLGRHPYAVYSAPIEVIGDKVGYIKIFYDLQPQVQEGLYTIGVNLLLLVMILLAITLLLNNFLVRLVLRPTFMLRDAILRLQGGNLGEQMPLSFHDEIGEVATAFNAMSAMLASQHQALTDSVAARERYAQRLEQLNASLETSVAERTAELTESNRRLQEESRERIRALEASRELEERLARSQKMEALGLLAGGIGHDLNNVLSGVVSYPDLLLMEMPDNHPLRKAITGIRNSGLKAAAIVQDLLALARRGVMQTTVLDLNVDIVQDYLGSQDYASLLAQHPGIRIETCLEPGLQPIKGSPVHIRKSLMNLVINAMEAQPHGGAIRISTANVEPEGDPRLPAGPCVLLRIEDDGVGIRPEDQARIFEPFYSKKVLGRSGTGLGMAVVWGTVQDHKGHIAVHSALEQGASFDLFFPATPELRLPAATTIPMEAYKGHGERILVVDDLADQRTLVAEILRKLNYRVDTAASGEAALEHLALHPADLVLLDMIMDPGMDGLDTYRRIIQLRPGQKAIIASGYAESERVMAAIALGVSRYLRKPYLLESLGQALLEELSRAKAAPSRP